MTINKDVLTEKLVNFIGERDWNGSSPNYKIFDDELHFYVFNNEKNKYWYDNYFYLDTDTIEKVIEELENDYEDGNVMIDK